MANYDLTYEGSRVQSILDTGDELRDAGYIFCGEATPSTVPGTPTERVAYIGGPGTYTNFGTSTEISAGCIGVFKYNGSAWSIQVINTGLSAAITTEAGARANADGLLQNAINAINAQIGNGYVYAGVATPSTEPISGKVFYLAITAGTYTNFEDSEETPLAVTAGINVLKNTGTGWVLDQVIAIDAEPTPGSVNPVNSGGVLNSIIQNGPAFDLSAYNAVGDTLATYADLNAALTALNTLPAAFKQPGMSFKFVLTSDNKYVQYRLMTPTFSTIVGEWQGVEINPIPGSKNLAESGGIENAIRRKGKYYGVFAESGVAYPVGTYLFTKEDIEVGDIISVDVTSSNGTTLLAMIDVNNNILWSRTTGTGNYTVTDDFNVCMVIASNGTITINKLEITKLKNRSIRTALEQEIERAKTEDSDINKSIGKEMFAAGTSFPKGQTVLTLDDVKPGDVLFMDLTCSGSTNLAFQTEGGSNLLTRGNGTYTWTIPNNFDHAVTVWGNGSVTINSMYIKNLQNRQIADRVTILESKEIYVSPSQGLAGIQDAIVKLARSGASGKIRLGTGTYSGDSAVSFSKYISSSVGTVYTDGLIIEGNGYGTYLTRNTNAIELVLNDTISDNIIVKNIRTNHQIQVLPANSKTRNVSFEKVWVQGRYYDEYKAVGASIVNIGAEYFYKKFTEFQSALPNYGTTPLEVHIYGRIVETSIPQLTMQNINFIGHNAVIEVANPKAFTISIATVNCKFKGIHFIKSGCGNYWDLAAVTVYSYDSVFEDCIFENRSFSPTPFNQADWNVGGEDKRGSRRYGIEVASSQYGKESNLVFINCKGIGSPYGFQNTRGFYILFGEPKLYNCVGVGGGVGEYGHGILSHRYSRPTLFNCIGYAGPMSYRMAAGIRIQCAGSPLMEGCIGYGGNNIQYKSNGVSYATLHAKCQELGISDESFFYDGSDVNYDGLTFKTTDDGYNSSRSLLLGSLTIDDLDIEALNSNSTQNYGIGLWAGQNKARLMNCVGYAGGGANSCGLIMENQNEPIIVGGYFGIEDMTDARYFKNDSGQQYMTFLPSRLNDYIPYTVTGITLLGGDYNIQTGDKIRVETVEATPKLIAEDTINNLNINIVNITETDVDAGVKLKVSVVNNGVVKSIADNSIRFQIFYNYNNTGTSAMNVGTSASPKITGTHFETNKASTTVVINSTRTDYNISGCKIVSRGNEDAIIQGQDAAALRMFNCVIEGDVDNEVTFAQTQSVNGSSNIKLT